MCRRAALGLVALLAVSACSSGGDGSSTASTATATAVSAEVVPSSPTEIANAPTSVAAPASTSTSTSSPVSASTPTTVAEAPLAPVRTSGPVTGGRGQLNATAVDLDAAGYSEAEYFVEGTASSFRPVGELGADGRWSVEPDAVAPFRTRLVVRIPSAERFSGVVLVEWLNVSGGGDSDPDWTYTHEEIIREGHAWVGVSAQAVGVSGGAGVLGTSATGLVGTDPDRYGTLQHPGDEFAFDIFTQAARSLLAPDGPAPLGDIERDLTAVIAIGESQSAFFLTTYANAIQPVEQLFDGIVVHSRGGRAAPFDASGITGGSTDVAPITPIVRTDSNVPVLVFQTETDLTVLGYAAARQPDTDSVKVWEVAGTAHADEFLLRTAARLTPDQDPGAIFGCPSRLNAGPQREVLQAALHHMVRWVTEGIEPPASPRLELSSTDPPVIARDELGIALGGIRTPPVDVPLVALSGDPAEGGPGFCFLFGTTRPFDPAVIVERYTDAAGHMDQFDAALDRAVAAGFVLADDAEGMRATARAEAVAAGL